MSIREVKMSFTNPVVASTLFYILGISPLKVYNFQKIEGGKVKAESNRCKIFVRSIY